MTFPPTPDGTFRIAPGCSFHTSLYVSFPAFMGLPALAEVFGGTR